MYSLYVYDEDLLRQGVVEDIDSLQWLSLYAGAGEVKLCVRPQTRIWTCSGVDAGSGAQNSPKVL